MSAKLFLHTVFCMGLAAMLVLHIRAGHRRIVYSSVLAVTVWLMLAPWLYRWFGGTYFPRVTLHWAQVAMVGGTLLVFTPGAGRRIEAIESDRFDLPGTSPAPLEQPRHYH